MSKQGVSDWRAELDASTASPGSGDLPAWLGPYRLKARLGSGGMGEVFSAHDSRLDRWVALKRLRHDHDPEQREAARRRFRREARAVASLDHPGIVRVHDLVETGDEDWMVMELVPGHTLFEAVRDGPMEPCPALDIGLQVAEALAAAHERGIAHRDLKLENVRVTEEGVVKILDFGLAKRLDPLNDPATGILTAPGAPLGTYRAMSPEQSQGREVGPSSDLFSFGVLLYELLTAVSPFQADQPLRTLERIRTHRPEPVRALRPEVPEALSDLVGRLLAKTPRERPASARAVAHDLAQLRRDAETTGTAPQAEPSYSAASTVWPAAAKNQQVTQGPAAEAGTEIADPSSFAVAEPAWLGARRWWRWPAAALAVVAIAWLLPRLPRVDAPSERGSTALEEKTFAEVPTTAPLYLAVAEPRMTAGSGSGKLIDAVPNAGLLGAAIRSAIFEALLGYKDLVPLAGDLLENAPTSPLGLARSLAAEEVLTTTARCLPRTCHLSSTRIDVASGRVLWTTGFEVPTDDPYLLARAIVGRLGAGFTDRQLRPDARRFEIDAELYVEFLELRRAHRKRERSSSQLLDAVESLRLRAPAFPDLSLFAADLAHEIYFHSRDEVDLERAVRHLHQAADLDPGAPGPRFRLARLSLDAGRLDEARNALDELDHLAPGDARLGVVRALLLEGRGHREEALETLRMSVDRHPSWRALFNLASLEYRLGRVVEARDTLERLLDSTPSSASARSLLAQLELLSGSLERAETLYTEMARSAPSVAVLSNLGLARLLQGRYAEAAMGFEQLLELEGDHLSSCLNLADALAADGPEGGGSARAKQLYLEVVERSEMAAGSAEADWQTLSIRAQALAHLGRPREAIAALGQALRRAPESPQLAYEAALVYTLAGELNSAVVQAERAAPVFGRRWFELPWFEPLRRHPAFPQLWEL